MSLSSDARLAVPVTERDHRSGPFSAAVTLLEYGDYECSFCGEAAPIVKQVQAALGDNLQFVFRNFPLTSAHAHAEKAAEAAESAGAQGRFWEMHDAIYAHQQDLTDTGLERLATLAGADSEQVARDLKGNVYEDRVYEDFMSGVRSGVNGTPTFFINGARYDGKWDAESLIAVLSKVARATQK